MKKLPLRPLIKKITHFWVIFLPKNVVRQPQIKIKNKEFIMKHKNSLTQVYLFSTDFFFLKIIMLIITTIIIEIKKYNISYLASKIFENVLSTVPKPPEVTE